MRSGNVDPSFWKGKRVMVFGHMGFKGSWATLWLSSMGAEVIGFSIPLDLDRTMYDIAKVEKYNRSVTGDIRDYALVEEILLKEQPDIVIDFAAQSLVSTAYENPLETIQTNVVGTANILHAIRSCSSVQIVLIVTSDKCYEEKTNQSHQSYPYTEDMPLGGVEVYSASKASQEIICKAYRETYFDGGNNVGIATLRAGNVLGGGDWNKDRLIPDIVTSLQEKRRPKIRNPNYIRPWQHILDPLAGYLTLAQKLWDNRKGFSEAWNFGPQGFDNWSVSQVADYICRRWNTDLTWQHAYRSNTFLETTVLTISSNKAREKLHWMPKLGIEQSLDLTLDWYEAYFAQKDMEAITLAEIGQYQKMTK